MRDKRVIGAFAALLAVLLGCFFMPDYVSGIIDRNTLGNLTVLDAKSISYESQQGLTMPERLRLLTGSNYESIMLKNGKLSESEARQQTISELRRFFGSSGLIGNMTGLTVDECLPFFVIDAETTINMIVWEARLSFVSGEEAIVILDEETGVIMHIILYRYDWRSAMLVEPGGVDEDLHRDDAELLEELICEYYGVPGVLTYDPIGGLGFYNVELDFDGVRVALYGIVQDSSITVNE